VTGRALAKPLRRIKVCPRATVGRDKHGPVVRARGQPLRRTPARRPWSAPHIALYALHYKAYDRGLITFDTGLRLVCSKAPQDHSAHATVAQQFKTYEDEPLTIPAEAAGPKAAYLAYQRRTVFGK